MVKLTEQLSSIKLIRPTLLNDGLNLTIKYKYRL